MATPREGHIVDKTSEVIDDAVEANDHGKDGQFVHLNRTGAPKPANDINGEPNQHHDDNDPAPCQEDRRSIPVIKQKTSAVRKFATAIIITVLIVLGIIGIIGIFIWLCTMVHSAQKESFQTQLDLSPFQNDSVASNYSIFHGNTIPTRGTITLSTNTDATLAITKRVKTDVQKEIKLHNTSFSELAYSFYSEGNISFEAELALIGELEVFIIFRLTRCDIYGNCFKNPDQVKIITLGKTISLRNTSSDKGYYNLSMTVGPFGNKTNIVLSQLRYNVVDPNQTYDRSCTTDMNKAECKLSIPSTEEYGIVTTFRNDQEAGYSISQDGFILLDLVLVLLVLVIFLIPLIILLVCVMIYSKQTFKRIKELKQQLAPQQETDPLMHNT